LKRPAELRWSRGGRRRRCPVLLGAALGLLLLARAPADPVPDRAAAAALLEQFRESIWSVPIYAEFDLIQMPRRGDETVTRGRFWGSRNERGPVTRMELAVGPAAFTHRVLVQGGPDGGVWTSDRGAPGVASPAALLAPLVPGVETTPFDLLPMPYLYWLDADLVAVQRVRGRAANIYVFTPSADFSAQYPAVRSVRAYLDTQYDALVQAEVTGPSGRIAKTLSLLELRKVGERWIPKDFDVRNEATRNKTRLSLTGVCLGLAPDPGAFDPAALGTTLAAPPAAKVLRVAP
jgi:hypothetical protein